MRFSDATCTLNGALTHVNNLFCTQGNQITGFTPVTIPGNTNWLEFSAH